MRTTIELPNSLRAKLLELAARRGEKGFSGLVREAVERYLSSLAGQEEELRRAGSLLGSLPEADADHLEEAVHRLRERWR
jgi:metal-responsive CopG/Arc/MetJ family transcriptional regulator